MNSLEDDLLDPLFLRYDGDFLFQVENLLMSVRLTANEVQSLRHLFADLEGNLQALAPGLQVQPFGSIVTGLGIKTSDVDCYIQLPNYIRPTTKHVIRARNIMRKRFRIFTNVFAITTAKVPIVKFLHIPTNCNCDVNFKSPAGVFNSQLIGHYLHIDENDTALHLAILIKYWSKVHKITGTNLLASYGMTMMVIFYLQIIGYLPTVYQMQKDIHPFMVDNWNMAFDRDMRYNMNNGQSLYELMGGFFTFYGNLNFDEIVMSPYVGRLINRQQFKHLNNVPIEFELYKQNVYSNLYKPLHIESMICIQDPFEHARNCSVAVYPKLAMKIVSHFQFAAKMFNELPPSKFLKAILTEDPTRMAPSNSSLKQKLKHTFQNKVMKNKNNLAQNKRNGPQHKNILPQNTNKSIQLKNTTSQDTTVTSQETNVPIKEPPIPHKNEDPSVPDLQKNQPETSQNTHNPSDQHQDTLVSLPAQPKPNDLTQKVDHLEQTTVHSENSLTGLKPIPVLTQHTPKNMKHKLPRNTTDTPHNIIPIPSQHSTDPSPQTIPVLSQHKYDQLQHIPVVCQSIPQTFGISDNAQHTSVQHENLCVMPHTSDHLEHNHDQSEPTQHSSEAQIQHVVDLTQSPLPQHSQHTSKPSHQPKKRGLQNNFNLIKCYEQIKAMRKPKSILSKHRDS